MRILLVNLFMLFLTTLHSQKLDKSQIIQSVKFYYSDAATIMVKTKFKSSIASDTTRFAYSFYVQSYKPELNVFIISEDSTKYLILKKNCIIYNDQEREYQTLSRKKVEQMGYYTAIENHSFNSIENQLKETSNILETDLYYILKSAKKAYYINKKLFELEKVIESIATKYGVEYWEHTFQTKKEIYNLDSVARYVISNYEVKGKAEKKKGISTESIGQFFPVFELGTISGKSYTNESIKGKHVLIDFFYQSCLPCIKAFPELISLRNETDTNLIIIGVDPFPSDTSLMQEFITKYRINYEIGIGASAQVFWRLVRNSGYPYMIYIDEEGKINEIVNGYWPAGFRRLRSRILTNIQRHP